MRLRDLDLPRSVLVNLAEEWILVARNKQIFYMKLEGYTYEEVAEEFNPICKVVNALDNKKRFVRCN